MSKYRYTLFDTVVFGNAAQGEQTLFQVPQGADATHTKSFTNMRGAGSLPTQEKFDIDKVGVYFDVNLAAQADNYNVWTGNYLEIRVADNLCLSIPLRAAGQYNAFNGHFTQAAAANAVMGGIQNDGYALDIPIHLDGGQSLKVIIPQITALGVASVPIRVMLHGVLDRPQ